MSISYIQRPQSLIQFHLHAINLSKLPIGKRKYRHFRAILHKYGKTSCEPFDVGYCEKGFYMARNRYNVEFVECRLSSKDEKGLEALGKKYNFELVAILEEILSKGYTVKAGFYPDDASYAVFCAADKNSKKNAGKMLSSWSDDIAECYLMTLYKITVIFKDGDWEVEDSRSGKWG